MSQTSTLNNQLSSLVEKQQIKYKALSRQDQWALKILAAFLGTLVLIYGIWLPAQQHQQDARDHWQQQQELYDWLKAQQPIASQNATGSPSAPADSDQPLLTRVTNSAKSFQIPLKRLQPEGDAQLRLWLEDINFNQSLKWLEKLQQQGLEIRDITVDKDQTSPGKVDMRLVLSRD